MLQGLNLYHLKWLILIVSVLFFNLLDKIVENFNICHLSVFSHNMKIIIGISKKNFFGHLVSAFVTAHLVATPTVKSHWSKILLYWICSTDWLWLCPGFYEDVLHFFLLKTN